MATDNIVVQFVATTPPITRILVTLTVVTSISTFLNFVKPQQLSYSRFYLWECQFHRIITTFFYYGKTNFELIMNFIFLYKYSSMLEESYAKKSDYFFVLLIVFAMLFATSNVIYIPFLATALSNTITYIWARKNPQGIVQIFGFVSFNAFYLPFIFPMISLVFEGRVSKDEILGIAVGQMVFYFKDVYPRFGRDFLKTPCWCHGLFNERGSCCESSIPSMRRRVSDFAKNKQQLAVEEVVSNVQDTRYEHGNEDCKSSNGMAHEERLPDVQSSECAQLSASSSDHYENQIEDEIEESDNDINAAKSDSSTKNGKSLDSEDNECENWELRDLESSDSEQHFSSQSFGNDSSMSRGEVNQNDKESFNSEAIYNGFDDRPGSEDSNHSINDLEEPESLQNANPDSAGREDTWDSE